MPRLLLPIRPALLLMLALLLYAAPGASAAGYAVHAWPGCGGGYNSGSFDSAGRTYVPCGNPTTIGVYDRDTNLVDRIDLEFFVSDVAPSPDGAYLYLAGASAKRLARTSTGWRVDSWQPAAYPMYGTSYRIGGQFVATDGAGNVYFADGAWAPNSTHTVVKYAPSGAFVTRFGEYSKYSWETGSFYWMLTGLAVSLDGSKVYTTEAGNNRVQTWTRGTGGAYSATSSFGGTAQNNADRQGYCDFSGWEGKFAAPYDVGLDAAGNIYVINTTCKQVLRFTPGFGQLTANVDIRVNGGDYPRPHGFAVAADGSVFIGENQRLIRPNGLAPGPRSAAPQRASSTTGTQPTAPTPPTGGTTDTSGGTTTDQTTRPPSGTTGTTPPTNADTVAPAVRARFARPVLSRTAGQLRLRLRLGCSERCVVTVTGWSARRQVARRVFALGAGQPLQTLRLGIRSTARPGRAVARIVARDASGNVTVTSRRFSVPR